MATVTKTYSLKVETQDKEVDALNKKLETTEQDVASIEQAGDKMTMDLCLVLKRLVLVLSHLVVV